MARRWLEVMQLDHPRDDGADALRLHSPQDLADIHADMYEDETELLG